MKRHDSHGILSSVLLWAARVSALLFLIIFVVFFWGEFDSNIFSNLTAADMILLLFIPILFFAGFLITWWKPLPGGIVIILSVVGFNLASAIISGYASLDIEFWILLIPGILFIICSILDKRKHTEPEEPE